METIDGEVSSCPKEEWDIGDEGDEHGGYQLEIFSCDSFLFEAVGTVADPAPKLEMENLNDFFNWEGRIERRTPSGVM